MAGRDFERIWKAYGRYGNKQASRRALEAIPNPDVDHIASRAAAWAASAKPGQRRMPLEKWLEAEKYDEADRSVKLKAKSAVPDEYPDEEPEVARRRTDADTAAEAAERARTIRKSAIQIDVPRGVPLTVVASAIQKRGEDTWLALVTDQGNVGLMIEGSRQEQQAEGQAHLMRLGHACGLDEVYDSAELHGRPFMVVGDSFAPVDAEEQAA
ncbi:hypothetical protein [Bradyrhizobium glycinis]|uniref:hypothetical protein n=1 Tax=Bradyrhizobium glycinis TaxID=2751812 RepID=UPI0018D9B7CC|nr:hypothetical protein [Bradyrhizobium glycinis]MBH5371432.1 hypothetical protein [Bradyrhizobium glycinis]